MTPEHLPGAHVRFVDNPDVPGTIIGRNRCGFNGAWEYEVRTRVGDIRCAGEHIEPDVARLPFRPRVVAGRDYEGAM